MLPARHRMRRPAQFSDTLRLYRGVGRDCLVTHLRLPDAPSSAPATIGLVVGRGVGNSVVRHRVSRRLRAQLADRLALLPAGSQVVVRARPEAATASSQRLGGELDSALRAALRRAGRGVTRGGSR